MKIIKLTAENVKRLSAVEIKPEGTLVTIAGKNGAGKTSVLDSIAYALGGQALVPSQPIRKGKTEARVSVDLGDLVVTRRFHRGEGGAISSTLVVTGPEGEKYPSPQGVLDKLVGRLTFDPLDFVRANSSEQANILRRLVGLDFAELDAKRAAAYDRRTYTNRQARDAEGQVNRLPLHRGVPEEEESIEEVSAELAAAEKAREEAANVTRDVALIQQQLAIKETQAAHIVQQMEKLQFELTKAQKERDKLSTGLEAAMKKRTELEANLPDTQAIRQRLTQVEATNQKVRDNQRHAEAAAKLQELSAKSAHETETIEAIDAEKQQAVAEAKFPVEGLGISADGAVTLDGIPFDQTSTAEQLRVSVAIGLALNPALKVLLVRDANALDSNNLAAVAQQAAEADAQVWLERVAEGPDGIAVYIEDGAVQ